MIKISLKAARVNSGLGILDAAPKIGVGKDTYPNKMGEKSRAC